MRRIGIIHPWMPQYRTAFFSSLASELYRQDVELHVYYGATPLEWAERNDSAHSDGMQQLPTKFFRVGKRNLSYKDISRVKSDGPFDLLVVEQAIRNIETYELMLRRRAYERLGFWGHGRTYTASKSALEERLKIALTKRADWFFGYTEGGVQAMLDVGFSKQRTTVVNNSIDTRSLKSDLDSIRDHEVEDFKSRNGITDCTALYLGGIDEAKRVPFLLKSAALAHKQNPEFRLLVAGDGSLAQHVKCEAKKEPWLIYLGGIFGRDKAMALRSASVLSIPGRVGLVAVDSLSSGVPIVTTDWPFHAPEFEYLKPDETVIVSKDDCHSYSLELNRAISDAELRQKLSDNCLSESAMFTTEAMAERFALGVMCALDGEPIAR